MVKLLCQIVVISYSHVFWIRHQREHKETFIQPLDIEMPYHESRIFKIWFNHKRSQMCLNVAKSIYQNVWICSTPDPVLLKEIWIYERHSKWNLEFRATQNHNFINPIKHGGGMGMATQLELNSIYALWFFVLYSKKSSGNPHLKFLTFPTFYCGCP